MSVRSGITRCAVALLATALLAVPAVVGAASQQAKLTAADGATSDDFGFSVAVDGDTAVVGAFFDEVGANIAQGSAYVFTRTGSGWTQQAKLTASDGAALDRFGLSVAVSGDTAVVGAFGDDGARGSAYVFTRTGSTWTQQAKLTASDGADADQFGISVAVDGDIAVVGARLDDVGANADQGSAYAFMRTGSTWTQQAKLTASDGAAADFFGWSVAVSGGTAVVGAPGDDVGANVAQGSAYAFTRAGSSWSEQAKLTASDGALGDEFALAVAVDGDTAVAGAPADEVGANFLQGSAYVFTRTGSSWSEQAKLTASNGAAGDRLGVSVAVSGDSVVVGARFDDVGPNAGQGSAYAFTRTGSSWSEQAMLTAADGAALDFFGISVAVSGDSAVVGASGDDVGANVDQGSAYVFTGLSGRGPPATLDLTPAAASNPVDSEHCVTAHVEDASGIPTPDITVEFSTSGSSSAAGDDTTDANGDASFCYTGPALPGADTIAAFADTNGNTSDDGASEPDDTAAKTWTLPAGTPCPARIAHGGWIVTDDGDRGSFGGNARQTAAGDASGNEHYQDHGPAQPMKVKSINAQAVTCSPDKTRASIFGHATINGSGTHDYRIDVQDNGEPGRFTDRYRIRLDTGYDSGDQLLRGGNIQIR